MSNTPKLPEFITIERASRMCGLEEQEILDLAALAEIQCGVIVPNLRGHAIPRHGFSESNRINGEYQAHKFVTTSYLVIPEHGEAQSVDVFIVSNFWTVGGLMKNLALADSPIETNVLWPYKNANLEELRQFAPWPEILVFLEEPFTVTRQSLRFIRSEIAALSSDLKSNQSDRGRIPGEDTNPHKQDSWQSHAFEIATKLDPEHTAPNLGAFAKEIHQELKKAGVVNRLGRTPLDGTIERDVLRGWKGRS